MRVLQILHTDEPGGIRTLAVMLEQDLAAHGVAVDTAVMFERPDLSKGEKLRAVAVMARRLLKDNHDAIMAYQATASILTGVVGRLRGCRARIVHQTCTPGATAAPVRLADRIVGSLGLYSVNIANTGFTLAEFRDYPARYRRAMTLIEHGLDAPVATASRAETRSRFGLPPDAPLILNVGRMAAQKNQAVLLDALPRVPGAVLVVAGHGPDEADLRARAAANGVADRVRLLGAVEPAGIANLYGACDLFAFPSVWETFGLAGVEAAMSGMPIVAADIAVLREVLASPVDRPPVVFAPTSDLDAWAAALNRFVASPPAAADRAQFAAAVAYRYSRARMSERYLPLLSGKGAPS
jgi:glycosyltransferase involved in cell wall biosynthesis